MTSIRRIWDWINLSSPNWVLRERHWRNKSTWSFLRDIEYQKVFLPRFCSNKLEYLNLTTEKTIEIFQSKWRNYGNKQDDGNSFARPASAIVSCGFLTTFKEYWMCLLLKKLKKQTNKQKFKKIASGITQNCSAAPDCTQIVVSNYDPRKLLFVLLQNFYCCILSSNSEENMSPIIFKFHPRRPL